MLSHPVPSIVEVEPPLEKQLYLCADSPEKKSRGLGQKMCRKASCHPTLLCTVLPLGSVHLLYKGLSLRK